MLDKGASGEGLSRVPETIYVCTLLLLGMTSFSHLALNGHFKTSFYGLKNAIVVHGIFGWLANLNTIWIVPSKQIRMPGKCQSQPHSNIP